MKKIIFIFIVVVTTITVFNACTSSINTAKPSASTTNSSTDMTRAAKVGNLAPDFQLARMDGSTVKFDDLRGQPSVIVFWTAWCPVCKEEAPHINELAARYEPKGVRVLGINIRDSPARAEGGIKDFGIRYQVARDADASVAKRYSVVGTPTIIFLDRNGIVRYTGNELPQDYPVRLDNLIAGNS